MSDFDFDELDKAVAGALGPDTTASPDEKKATDLMPETFDEAPNEKNNSASAESTTPAQEEVSRVKEAPRSVPAARRSSGRFMDVVHPSSDMRTRTSSQTAPAPTTFTTPTTSPEPSVVNEPPVAAEDISEAHDNDTDWNAPLESPFLPDAKVEKRPLGGEPAPLLSSLEDELKLEAPDEPLLPEHAMPDPIDFAAQSSALSSENEDTGTDPEVVAEPAPAPIEMDEPKKSEKQEDTQPEGHAAPSSPEPEVPAGPSSISQQYVEQPRDEQASGAIYDTENYHQPLAPTPKKRSGAWTIMWIILLVILGAGAGLAFYLFVLPML